MLLLLPPLLASVSDIISCPCHLSSVSRIIGGNRSNDHEEVIKSDENGNEDELWSDDEYESEGMEDYDDVLGVSYADIQAGDDNALAGASKDGNTTPQLSSYCCRDDSSSHSDEYYQCRPKRTSVIVDLTSDGNESDGTKQPLNHYKPQNIVQSTKYPTNVIGPSQTESIGDFSEDDKDLKPVSGMLLNLIDCNFIKWYCGG